MKPLQVLVVAAAFWVSVPAAVQAQIIGEIRAFAFAPDSGAGKKLRTEGWREAKGQPVVIIQCKPLFNAIQHAWGTRDKNNEFNLPDLRGMFLRGLDTSAINDKDAKARIRPGNAHDGGETGAKVGSFQPDAMSAKHGFVIMQVAGNSASQDIAVMQQRPGQTPAAKFANEAGDVRPMNVAVSYWIFAGKGCVVNEPATR